MKKVLVLTNHSYMLYRFRLELLQKLAESCQVVLSMPFVGHEEDFQALGFRCIETPVDRRGINPGTDWNLLKTYVNLLKEESPDFVITYSIKPNVYGGIACTRLGIPFYANVQGLGTAFQKPVMAQVATLLYRYAFRHVNKVFFENKANAEEFRKRHILSPDRQVTIPGAGVNLELYPLCPYPANHIPHFLYLGRIMKEKGMDELLCACNSLFEEGIPFHLDLVGFFEDEYKDQVDDLVSRGIATFHGFQENPLPYYANADCIILPSYHEGLSNVLLEAAAVGRPVITTNIPGCRETVDHNHSGYLVEVKNSGSLLGGMKKFLSLSPAARKEMGLRGRAKMESEFRKEKVVAQVLRALPLS